jgi:antitoxin CptB
MNELKKLAWQCRRGTKELDAILQNYLQTQYLQANPSEQQQFLALLQLEDDELIELLVNSPKLVNPFIDLLPKLRSFVF